VLHTIQPSTVFLNDNASELNFGDILNITPVGANQTYISTIFHPYAYDMRKQWGQTAKAKHVQDRYSVGVIFLEMLVGTDIMLTAKMEYQLERLITDCSPYLDIATVGVLEYLILDKSYKGLETYVQEFVKGEKDVVRDCILGFESALLEDAALKLWQTQGENYIKTHTQQVYDQFRIYPGDVKRNINWESIANEVQMIKQ
jgi:hypothetical protein